MCIVTASQYIISQTYMSEPLTSEKDLIIRLARSIGLVSGTFLSLALLIVLSFSEQHYLLFFATLAAFGYFLVMAMHNDAYHELKIAFLTRTKYRTVHPYFDKDQKFEPTKETPSEQSPVKNRRRSAKSMAVDHKRHTVFMRDKRSSSPLFNNQTRASRQTEIVGSRTTIQAPEREAEYIETRKKHKKCLQVFIRTFKLKLDDFEDMIDRCNTDFRRKLLELVHRYDETIKEIVETIEQQYDVKVQTSPEQTFSISILKISLQQAIKQVFMLQFTECMPWQQNIKEGEADKKHIHSLIRLSGTIKQIDQYLQKTDQKMKQEERSKAIEQLRSFAEKKPHGPSAKISKQILLTVAYIYNQKLKNEKDAQNYMLRTDSQSVENGLKMKEKRVAGRMHVDLQIIPQSRVNSVLQCMPGEGNLWSLLTYAYYVFKLKV